MSLAIAGKRSAVLAKWLVLAGVLVSFALPVDAAQLNAPFKVVVHFKSTVTSAFCIQGPGPDTFGAIVTVVCATGSVVDVAPPPTTAVPWKPIHGGAYRFTRLTENELPGLQFSGVIDSYTGAGTVTSWRLVNLADRDYLEILIGW